MKGKLIGTTVVVTLLAAVTYGVSTWEASKSRRQEALCKVAQEHLKTVQIEARAMATG